MPRISILFCLAASALASVMQDETRAGEYHEMRLGHKVDTWFRTRHDRTEKEFISYCEPPARTYIGCSHFVTELFHLLDGFCIAKQLGRRFFINYNRYSSDSLDSRLEKANQIFPKLRDVYELIDLKEPRGFGWTGHISDYIDPLRYLHHPAKYLYMDIGYGQNWKYFEKCESEVHELLTFSETIKEYGDYLIVTKNLTSSPSYVCAHIRRTDFKPHHAETTLETTVALLQYVLGEQGVRKAALFGDDRPFMRTVIDRLTKNNVISQNSSFVSTFSEGTDFYLASRICQSFIITAPISTFGFWTAYLTKNQENVYYLYTNTRILGKHVTENIFPKSWTALEVSEQFDVRIV